MSNGNSQSINSNISASPKASIARHAYITQTPLWQERDILSQKNGPHATVFMINGDRYLGEWKGNKKHGMLYIYIYIIFF